MNAIKIIYLLILLTGLNLAAHFLPPERVSLAPDDYVFLERSSKINLSEIPTQMLRISDRPLNFVSSMLQGKLLGDNPSFAFFLLVLTNTFVLLAIFYLFIRIYNDKFAAFIATAIFCVLPNKLEIYHNSVFINLNMALFLSVLSIIFFISFTDKPNKIYLFMSMLAYTAAIFWYAVGFFIPAIIIAYCYFFNKKKFLKYSTVLVVVAIFYVVYRYTDGFGFAKIRFEGCNKLDLALFPAVPLADLFHHYFGRYMLRNIIYGVYKFVSIEQPWLWLSISLDIALLVLTYNYIKTNKIKKNDYHLLFFAFIVFTIFIFLFLLNKSGGIASRYLTLPSIGVAMVLVWVLGKSQVIWRSVFILAMAISLVVCQGNSWIQFKASRINAGIIQSIKDRNARLASSEAVIFDFKSLADNIAYTLVKRDFNTLNMYYGALVFHKPELESMARLLAKKDNLAIYVATSTIIKDSDYSYEFEVSEENSYRSVIKNKIKLPQKGTLIINYNDIFPEGFK